jgi:hypothetical protein
MTIRLVQSWASPSTLHLRVMVTASSGAWSVFRDLAIPLRDLDDTVLLAVLALCRDSGSFQHEPGLW